MPAQSASALLALVEGVVLLGFAAFYVWEILAGGTDDVTRAATSGGLILLFGVFLLTIARGWARARDWPRTPTLLWNALLLPVAWSLHESGQTLLAVALGLVAVASIGAALLAPTRAPVSRADMDGTDEMDGPDGADPSEPPEPRSGPGRSGPVS